MRNYKFTTVAFSAVAFVLAASSCGRQAFVTSNTVEKQMGPGTFSIPPKVDILLAEDDTGAMLELRPQIASQFPGFLNSLDTKGWDYHFATIPLTTDRELSQIVASRYDSNWGSQWLKPFPWAQPDAPGTIESYLFRRPLDYSGFIRNDESNYQTGAIEDGFQTIYNAFGNAIPNTSFLRQDALLVVLSVGDGEDTSLVNRCTRSDGLIVPCESVTSNQCTSISQYRDWIAPYGSPHCGSRNVSFNHFRNALLSTKVIPQMVQFHAAVAQSTNCRGARAFVGSRYMQMANAVNGRSYNICTSQISDVLNQLASSLQSIRVAFKTRYVFIAEEPDPSTIRVVKYINGNPQLAVELPEDPSDGWTYVGWQENVYAVDEPYPMNQASGYAIELSGSAKLEGDDTVEVIYKAAGIEDSSS